MCTLGIYSVGRLGQIYLISLSVFLRLLGENRETTLNASSDLVLLDYVDPDSR